MDDQQRARALLAQEWRKLSEDAPADMLEAGCELPPLVAAAVAAITAALRAALESVALRTAMTTLEQIASAPDDKGAKFNAASCVAFLTTQGAAGGTGFVSVPVEPTEEMIDRATWEEVGGHCHSCTAWPASHSDARRVWTAMLAARPQGVK